MTTPSSPKPTIAIIGCGYVGLTLAAVLANAGYTVYALEVDPERLAAIKAGRSFFYEAGADPLIAHAVKSGKLLPTNAYDTAIPASQIVMCSVGTPDKPDGSSNLTYVFDAAAQAAKLMRPGTIYVQKSTVPVETGEHIEALFKASDKTIDYVSCPEFSREGTAILDTLWFDRVVAGSTNHAAAERVLDLHRTIEIQCDQIARRAGLQPPKTRPIPQYLVVGRASAELIKVAANAFLALKISFANSIAKFADATNADIIEVMDGVGSDRRIGRAFLNAGRGYGGGCFPKDVSGLIHNAGDNGVSMEIMEAVVGVNESMPRYIISKLQQALGAKQGNSALRGQHVALLGLAFKAGTSDVRRSPALVLANGLAADGALVSAFDPEAMNEAKPHLEKTVVLAPTMKKALEDAEVLMVATGWPAFTTLTLEALAAYPQLRIVVDAMNCLDPDAFRDSPLIYIGVGRHI